MRDYRALARGARKAPLIAKRNMRPASEVLPPALYAKLVADSQARRAAREPITLHLAPEVAARLRAAGHGWEDRAAAILREAVGL